MSYPENSVGRPLPMEADPDAMNDKDEVRSLCFFHPNPTPTPRAAASMGMISPWRPTMRWSCPCLALL